MSQNTFVVRVTDHAHYMEPEGQYTGGEFATFEEAAQKCQLIIDTSLSELYAPGMTAEELKKQFFVYGEEATCDGFDALEYLQERCTILCKTL